MGKWVTSKIYPINYLKNSDLTDEDLRTHNKYGAGSYTWCQENLDDITYRRVYRGYNGASHLYGYLSWHAGSHFCFRPVLEALQCGDYNI